MAAAGLTSLYSDWLITYRCPSPLPLALSNCLVGCCLVSWPKGSTKEAGDGAHWKSLAYHVHCSGFGFQLGWKERGRKEGERPCRGRCVPCASRQALPGYPQVLRVYALDYSVTVVTLDYLLWLPLSYPQQAEETSLTGHSSLAFPCFLYSGQERGHRTMSPHSDEHASTTRFLSSAHLYSSQHLDAPEHLTSVFRAMHKGRVHILECFITRENWSGAVVQ